MIWRRILIGAMALWIGVTTLPIAEAQTDGRALENILVSRQDNMGVLRFLPRCRMRYLMHSPPDGGRTLRVRLTLSTECQALLDSAKSETYDPPGSSTYEVEEISFDALNRFTGTITIRFKEPRVFTVRPAANGWLEVRHDLSRRADEFADAVPLPLPQSPPVVEPAPPKSIIAARKANGVASTVGPSDRRSSAATGEIFVLQLGVFRNPEPAVSALSVLQPDREAVSRAIQVGSETWSGVFIGPFASEAEAESERSALSQRFPESWVRVIDQYDALTPISGGSDNDVAAAGVQAGVELDAEQSRKKLEAGRNALLDQRYGDAIFAFEQILADGDNAARPAARELLGVAEERAGNSGKAMAEYRAWLAENGAGTERDRVQARLDALAAALQRSAPTASPLLDAEPVATVRERSFTGGVAQYYRREVAQRIDNGDGLLAASALYNYADLTYRQSGERFDVLARGSASYVFDANSDSRRQLDTGWVSDAYLRIDDNQWNADATLGRQRAYGKGLLSRFDGINANWRALEDRRLGVVAGIPLDSVRYVGNRDRLAYGLNAGATNLWDQFDLEAYAIWQTADGLSDREATGAELRFHGLSTQGLLWFDYDWSFQALNHLLLSVEHQFNETISVYAQLETGKLNTLTARNALSGQVARTLSELGQQYTEGQIRTLAADRTPDADRVSFGINFQWDERTRVTLDAMQLSQSSTPASGGVAAVNNSGDHTFVSLALMRASAVTGGDFLRLAVSSLRSSQVETERVVLDWRRPAFWGLRLNPVLGFAQHNYLSDGSEQWVIEPSIRLFYRWRQRFLFELEAGGRYSNRELAAGFVDPFVADGEEELLGNYITIGYRMEF